MNIQTYRHADKGKDNQTYKKEKEEHNTEKEKDLLTLGFKRDL